MGNKHNNADLLSRLPVDPPPKSILEPAEHIMLTETLDNTPLTVTKIKQ